MKKTLLLAALQLGFIAAHAQNNKKKPTKPSVDVSAIAMLSADQKTATRQVNQQFVADMKTLLAEPVTNPMERRQKIEKLKASRDSTLKARLGEETFTEYRKKAIVKKQ